MAAGSRYSDQERREAVVLYVLHGNWKRVSELTGIPQRTLNDWATQSWYGTLVAEVRAEKGAELDGTYTRILDEATGQLLDRLKNGDPYIVGGEVRRKPVAARDLALVAAITFDKRALSRAEAPLESREVKLDDLAAWLRDYGEKRAKEIFARGTGPGGEVP